MQKFYDMKITICGSTFFAEEMLKIKDKLSSSGHEVFIPQSVIDFKINGPESAIKMREDRGKYISKLKPHYTKHHFNLIENSDAILVVNSKKNGIENYIGGATFAEIMLAFHFGKKIFFLNPIPKDEKMSFVIDELETVKPIILNGDL